MSDPVDLDDDMRLEYDLDNMEIVAVGRHAERIRQEGATVRIERTVAFEQDIEAALPTDEAVNEALRSVMMKVPAPTPPAASGS